MRLRSRRFGAAQARPAVALLCAALLACSACSAGADDPSRADQALTVLAAASLTETFTELGKRFEAEHDGVEVRLAFDSSATLAQQVVEGAPADVLATADENTMATAVEGDAVEGDPEVFATNKMVLVVPADNPAGIEEFTDIDRPQIAYVTCAVSAPCGVAAQMLLDLNDVEADPKSFEVDVKAVLSKVALGEADAGLVYATDAVAAGDEVTALDIPRSEESVNAYPIAAASGSENVDLAREWIDLVLSGEGRSVLEDAGFGPPS